MSNQSTNEQRTQKRYDRQFEWLVSHWENGFIRILENGELEMVSAQIGRGEVLIGSIEASSARMFELEGNVLHYVMEMHTTKVERLTPHLKIALQRIKQ